MPPSADYLEITGAKVHNLKNLHLKLPHHQLIVVTGVSGSGKSSLVFDLIYAEGRRRYMETLENNYVRNFLGDLERPEVDQVTGLPCVIGIGQETTGSRSLRSTIGTLTDINSFLRLLFAKVSTAYSYLSGHKMAQQSLEQIKTSFIKKFHKQKILLLAPLVTGRKGHYNELFIQLYKKKFTHVRINGVIEDLHPYKRLDRHKTHHIELVVDHLTVSDRATLEAPLQTALYYGKGTCVVLQEHEPHPFFFSLTLTDPTTGLSYPAPSPNTFSFNSPYGACPHCHGIGTVTHIDQTTLIPNPSKSIAEGAIPLLGPYKKSNFFAQIEALLALHHTTVSTPIQEIPPDQLEKILYGKKKVDHQSDKIGGIIGLALKKHAASTGTIEGFIHQVDCPECLGSRLRKEAMYFKIRDKNIADLSSMSLRNLFHWLANLESDLTPRQQTIAQDPLEEIRKRIQFLLAMNLGYLSLNRPLQTLSNGEIRRIRLATQISAGDAYLVGLMVLLDEPSIGLHPRDNQYVIDIIRKICEIGNTVIVIEHDKETMLAADYLLEIGPGAGKHGGEIVAEGPIKEFLKKPSTTARYLKGEEHIPIPQSRRKGNGHVVRITQCNGRNLKNVTLTLPLGTFIAVTGVSGSGKSTLIQYTLLPLLQQQLYSSFRCPLPHKSAEGTSHLNKVLEIDQTPIGRTPRSNPATYTGLFTHIRTLFTQLPQAKVRNYKAGRFSFNVKGGRCETCQGAGIKLVEMEFLPSVRVLCETCQGKRYNRETLEVQYKGKSIADILDMTVDTALSFFQNHPKIKQSLRALQEVGLGYITLGQHATTFSGGEAQRIKIAVELAKKETGNTLYILNEPTTGLHFQDIKMVLEVLQKLVDKGNTVIVIEHNLDAIKVADHVIDLGPESGDQGGEIIATGTPEDIAKTPHSHTGQFLAKELLVGH